MAAVTICFMRYVWIKIKKVYRHFLFNQPTKYKTVRVLSRGGYKRGIIPNLEYQALPILSAAQFRARDSCSFSEIVELSSMRASSAWRKGLISR